MRPIATVVDSVRRAVSRRSGLGGPSPAFIVIIGFVVGALAAVLVIPDGGGRVTAGPGAGRDDSATGGGPGGGAGGEGAGADILAPDSAEAPAPASGEAAPLPGDDRGATAVPDDPSGAPPAASTPTPGARASPASGPVRGVTDDAIKIGVALLDVGSLSNLGPAFDNGDRRAHFESILRSWRDAGLIPVHGRDVRFVYRTYGVLDPAEQRAACVGLVQDEQVFAVIADSRFQDAGSECVSREMATPLVASDAPTDEVFARSHPRLFAVQMSESRLLRNLVHWADRGGHLDGKKIGIYYSDAPVQRQLIERTVKAELATLGHRIAAEATTPQPLGGPQDALAVQRFRTAGVDVALLFTSKAGFMQQAEAQAYRPSYLDSDFLSGTTNTASSTYPPSQFDGALAMTGLRYGEWKAGIAPPDVAQACAEDYRRHSGKRVTADAREAEWVAMNKGCDAARVLLRGLEASGRALTPEALVASMERLADLPMGIAPPATFTADRHHGVTAQRTLQWAASCRCWKALGSFRPLFVA